MKILKSHFWYHKSQRNGIFFLILLILIIQSVIVFGNFSSDDKIDLNSKQVLAFHQQIDSIRTIEIENRKPKIYPFNPNYITDSKGEQLGMSIEEIDRLLAFRKTNKFVNSKSEFQRVTQISDSLLHKIAPYFKFPNWVVKQNSSPSSSGRKQIYYKKNEKIVSTTDINKATAQDFRTVSGVGAAFSERIINYRTKLQGFSIEDQLKEVWGLDVEVANKVLSKFKIVDKPIINKINVNTASFKALLKNPYIDYSLCKKIFEYRDEVAELQNISELKNIIDFPLDKYDRIVLYLMAE
ncbi:helix-hairpin-helix domain-containing protein [Polaribacter sp. HaHaR_3_91]|uniref:helix-hairpin-helix domain-containing protein n=1 Tax=Polaribacter sp. HaHaR_3_91 TaxID=2745561 RepID=UPI001C4E3AA8|nr:helix-hairpin-helix domain-containing protein [Polaribacter sp. HaHaR_3_91]QXP64676.1 helix-hairpin-helix domain-containing protein [Polaribacter sp. HaHaR_3_91]